MPAAGAAAIGEDTATRRPPPAATMRGTSGLTTLSDRPEMLVEHRGVWLVAASTTLVPPVQPPTRCASASTRPKRWYTASMAADADSASRRSAATRSTRSGPSPCSSFRPASSSARRSGLDPRSARSQPSAARSAARTRPRPPAAPVMRATGRPSLAVDRRSQAASRAPRVEFREPRRPPGPCPRRWAGRSAPAGARGPRCR